MSMAEWIAEQFGRDGQRWTDREGRYIEDLCCSYSGRQSINSQAGIVAYRFDDGSAILIFGGGWDVAKSCLCGWCGSEERGECNSRGEQP